MLSDARDGLVLTRFAEFDQALEAWKRIPAGHLRSKVLALGEVTLFQINFDMDDFLVPLGLKKDDDWSQKTNEP